MNRPVRPTHPVYILMLVPGHACPGTSANAALVEELAAGDGAITCTGCGVRVALPPEDLPSLAREVQRSRELNNGYRVMDADLIESPPTNVFNVYTVPA